MMGAYGGGALFRASDWSYFVHLEALFLAMGVLGMSDLFVSF